MRLGILPPYRSGVVADPIWMTEFAQLAESVGFESLYLVEHAAVAAGYADGYPYSADGRMPLPEDCPIPDPLELTAYLAGRTETLRFSTGVLVGPNHNPVVLAKRLATLDALSAGRVDAGFGVGWMREEVESTGADFSTRGRRTTELLVALRTLLDDDPASFSGEFFEFSDLRVHPRPSGRIRLDVGGHAEAAALRAGRVGDGLHPLGLDPETLEGRWELARATASGAGRNPDALELSLTMALWKLDADAMETARAAGASRIICSTATSDSGVRPSEMEKSMRAAVELAQA
ncbi:MAG: LLM class F420-dependent oxidoreductase [Microthrixaceae bacterium]